MITLESAVPIDGMTGAEISYFLLNPADDRYQAWWPVPTRSSTCLSPPPVMSAMWCGWTSMWAPTGSNGKGSLSRLSQDRGSCGSSRDGSGFLPGCGSTHRPGRRMPCARHRRDRLTRCRPRPRPHSSLVRVPTIRRRVGRAREYRVPETARCSPQLSVTLTAW
jgi:hypothetical protein